MKIIQVVTQMEAAGAQKIAYLLHQGFLQRRHESELWFLYTKRPAYHDLPGVKSLLEQHATPWDYPQILARLCAQLWRHQPDILITHTHYANVMGQAAAFFTGVRTRIAVHHNPLPTYPRGARLADQILGAIGAYSAIVTVSDAVAKTIRYGNLSRFIPTNARSEHNSAFNRVHRIYNGIPSALPEPRSEVLNQLNLGEDAPVLLSVARLAPQKNQATLLRALCELPEAKLILAGDGESAPELRRQVSALALEGRVVFTGEIAQAEIFTLMRRADVFVFPSLWEAMPLAAVEAMSAGMAIVASDIPAHREVLGQAALFVPATDFSALAGAVRGLLTDAALTRQLRITALQRSQRFNAEEMVNQYVRLISHGLLPEAVEDTKRWSPSANVFPALWQERTAKHVPNSCPTNQPLPFHEGVCR